ncbi:PepSY domain-containing protein [Vagococcus xieshaowenii]|nr:PepSY domain-containing protein [Vagococcus xieshaowenii]
MKKIVLGAITLATVMTLGACKNETTSTTNEQNNNSSTQVAKESSEVNQNSSSSTSNLSDFSISLDDAIAIYQKEMPNTDITSISIDSSFKNYYYEISGMDDNNEYELKISVDTGDVSDKRDEKLDRDEQNGVKRNEEKLTFDHLKPLDELTELAVKQVGGGQATDWSLEKDLSVTYWEIKVENGKQKHEVKINAETGDILETEQD